MSVDIAYIKRSLGRIPYAKSIGVEPFLMGEEMTLILPYQDNNIGNPLLPALHGGVVGGFMETCALIQLMLSDETDKIPKPIGITVDYLRRGKPVDTYARADIVRQGSRVATVRVIAWQARADEPIATLHGHFLTAGNAPKAL